MQYIRIRQCVYLALMLLMLFIAACRGTGGFPEEIIGIWTTEAEQYRDKYLEISRSTIFIGFGGGEQLNLSIKKIRKIGLDGEWIFFCEDQEGTTIDMAMVVKNSSGRVSLKLKHQEDIIWTRLEADAKMVEQAQGPTISEPVKGEADDAQASRVVEGEHESLQTGPVFDLAENEQQFEPKEKVRPVPLQPRKIVLGLQPNSLKLTDAGSKLLIDFLGQLKSYPGATVWVKGYVSAKTNSAENVQLSVKRAKAVEKLMLEAGIDQEQIEIVGMGNREPIDSNDTRAGRAKNRRVEIEVISDGTELQ